MCFLMDYNRTSGLLKSSNLCFGELYQNENPLAKGKKEEYDQYFVRHIYDIDIITDRPCIRKNI